jgi:hypothetical protein
MSFFKRLEGVFFAPKPAFQALAEKPVWVDALIVLLILLAVFAYFVTPYQQKDQVQMFKDNAKLKERLGDTRYTEMMARLEAPPTTGTIIRSVVIAPLINFIGILFSSLILLVMGRFISSQGGYVPVMAAVVHANFVDKLLGNAVRALLIGTRHSVMQTSTSLALLFPKMEVTTPAYIILGQLDFFQIWMFGVLGLALSAIFKIETKKAMFISYGFWLLKSLLYIAFGIFGLRFLR